MLFAELGEALAPMKILGETTAEALRLINPSLRVPRQLAQPPDRWNGSTTAKAKLTRAHTGTMASASRFPKRANGPQTPPSRQECRAPSPISRSHSLKVSSSMSVSPLSPTTRSALNLACATCSTTPFADFLKERPRQGLAERVVCAACTFGPGDLQSRPHHPAAAAFGDLLFLTPALGAAGTVSRGGVHAVRVRALPADHRAPEAGPAAVAELPAEDGT